MKPEKEIRFIFAFFQVFLAFFPEKVQKEHG